MLEIVDIATNMIQNASTSDMAVQTDMIQSLLIFNEKLQVQNCQT